MTRRCFIIGHPVAQSRSPLIHGAWIAEHGLDGSYERVDVAPAALPDFIDRLRMGEFAGGNVTVPHKEAVLALVDEATPTARLMGAANTLWVADGKIHADNTDGAGFLAHLDASAPGWGDRVRSVLILGAGGAARGIAHALRSRGAFRIVLTNRSADRAQELARSLGGEALARDWSQRHAAVGEADLVVNTTALGMKGQPPLELDLSNLKPGAIVDDAVYVPLRTPLLDEAARRGATVVDGLGMLLNQAVPGFARWFGVTPAVTSALRASLETDIARA